jgi:hypothetical protein
LTLHGVILNRGQMRHLVSTVLLASTLGGLSHPLLQDPQEWQQADAATVRLKPAVFADLSAQIRKDLDRRGCTVPQSSGKSTPHNVVHGNFTSANQVDVAVLCSKENVSSILVFRGGSIASVGELASHRDATFLQVIGPGNAIGYSRSLERASPKYIHEHHVRYGGPKPPPLNHEGIEDCFDGKASVVWYWYGGRWLQLTGAD